VFSTFPNAFWPGLRIGQPEETPGFRISKDGLVPTDLEPARTTYAYDGGDYVGGDRTYDPLIDRSSSQNASQWTATPSEIRYVNTAGASPTFSDRLGSFVADVGDVAKGVGTKANAFVNGAYSVFPGLLNAGRAVARGTGILGSEEFRRFGQEADIVGASLGQIARHPEPAVRAAREA
jgi:hypothetical protein